MDERAMKSFKLTAVVSGFDGRSDADAWLTKFDLVIGLQGLSEQEASMPPILLKGLPYQHLRRMDAFTPYVRLLLMRWYGEQIHSYLTEIPNMSRLANIQSEVFAKRAFVTSLQHEVSKEMRSLPNVEKLPLEDLASRVGH
ncbi:hypothetical protein GJ496_010960 [Pomphorhynchus laevis]|nr:hypothetical protein GJ496_010960 [Pomphorhynchus laevis]